MRMMIRARLAGLVVMSLAVVFAMAKDKTKAALPQYVLQAHTVAVVIDPGAGMAVDDPQANRVAQKDVETALLNWGRFTPMAGTQGADLIIVIRRGSGRLVTQTIPNRQQNNRPGMIDPTDNGVSVGAQHGTAGSASGGVAGPATETPQAEIGNVDDSFSVYDGKVDHPLDASAAWRYVAADGLKPHGVPAVAEFRKVVAAAEKAAAAAKKP